MRSRRRSLSTPQAICTTLLICCAAASADRNAWPSWNKSWLLLGHKPSCRCHNHSLRLYCMHSRPLTNAKTFAKPFCDEASPPAHWQAVSQHSKFKGQWATFQDAAPALLYMLLCLHTRLFVCTKRGCSPQSQLEACTSSPGVPVSHCSKSTVTTKRPRLTSNMLTLQVFENGALLVVVSFDAAVAEQEGDLTGYMNELARLNSVPGSWQLCKSTANWGQVQVHATHKSPALFCDSSN